MTKYFRSLDKVMLFPDNIPVALYDTLPGSNFVCKMNQGGEYFLEDINPFVLPSKVYGDTQKNSDRILKTFNMRNNSLGVLLSGYKGSGKSLLAKYIAMASGLPTIVITEPHRGDAFNKFVGNLPPSVLLFDEFEKVYQKYGASDKEGINPQEGLLSLLDGVISQKKLFIFTVNDAYGIDDHMINRPGRIHYYLNFSGLGMDFVEQYLQENLIHTQWHKELAYVAQTFDTLNFDILQALVTEVNNFNESPKSVVKILNARAANMEQAVYELKIIHLGERKVRRNGVVEAASDVKSSKTPKLAPEARTYKMNPMDDSFWIPSERGSIHFSHGDLVSADHINKVFVFRNQFAQVTCTKEKPRYYEGMDF